MSPDIKKSGPSWTQGFLLFFGGLTLAFFFGAAAFGRGNTSWVILLAVGFVVSAVMTFFGAVSLMLRLIRGSEK